MGVRRVLVSETNIALWLQHGTPACALVDPIRDAQVLDARYLASPNRRTLELLIESAHLDGPGSEGCWPAIAEGRWDEFPVLIPLVRRTELSPEPVDDPDDRDGEIAGA